MSEPGTREQPGGRSKPNHRSSLRTRWVLGLTTLLLLTVVTGAFSLIETRRITNGFESSAAEVDRETAVMGQLRLAVAGEVALAHQLVDFGAAAAPTFLQLDVRVDAVLREARALYDDDAEQALIDSARSKWDDMFSA